MHPYDAILFAQELIAQTSSYLAGFIALSDAARDKSSPEGRQSIIWARAAEIYRLCESVLSHCVRSDHDNTIYGIAVWDDRDDHTIVYIVSLGETGQLPQLEKVATLAEISRPNFTLIADILTDSDWCFRFR